MANSVNGACPLSQVATAPLPDRRLAKSALSQRAYTSIKCMILDQEIAPATRVAIDLLASLLGVSQTPVREALARLEGDGLVERKGNGLLYAASLLDRAAFEQLYAMRLLLEPQAAALAARSEAARSDGAAEATLRASLATMTGSAARRSPADYVAFVGADATFHETIARIGDNRFLYEAVHHLHSHHRLAFLYRRHGVTDWRIARREHEAIAALIAARDATGAEAAMRAHITRSREVLRGHFAHVAAELRTSG